MQERDFVEQFAELAARVKRIERWQDQWRTRNRRVANLRADEILLVELRLLDDAGDNHVGFKAASVLSANVVWVLPTADGADKQFLQTNGSGVLTFADVDDDSHNHSHDSTVTGVSADDHHNEDHASRHEDGADDALDDIDHGSQLTGLGDDDHTIYLLADGSRVMTGALQDPTTVDFKAHTTDPTNVAGSVWYRSDLDEHLANTGQGTATLARTKTGTYTGDGNATQAITGVNFKPKYVRIWKEVNDGDDIDIWETTPEINDDLTGGAAAQWDPTNNAWTLESDRIVSLDADGFTVGDGGGNDPNVDEQDYNYLAMG